MNIFEKYKQRDQECRSYGFHWTEVEQLFTQISNEIQEVKEALDGPRDHLQEEIGDLMEAAIELCIFLKFDPEETLIHAAKKFDIRYENLKKVAGQEGFKDLKGQPISKLMDLWDKAKKLSR